MENKDEKRLIDPKKLVGEKGNEFVLNLLQNPPNPNLGIVGNVERFQKEYMKLPFLKSFSFSTYNELSNEYMKIPISNVLAPLFGSLKNELLDSSRTGDQESIDIALKNIQPYSLLPSMQPIFFTLLKRSNNPAKYYHVLEKSEDMLSKCPQEVLIRIWRSEDRVFRKLVIHKLRIYSERFEEEKQRMIKRYDSSMKVIHKEDALYDLLRSVRKDRVLIRRVYDILRSLFSSSDSVVSRSAISHFFVDILVEGKAHPIYPQLKPLIKIATRNEEILYQSTTSQIYEMMKEINYIIIDQQQQQQNQEQGRNNFLIDLQMICLVSKNTFIQLLVNYCLVNNPLNIGILSQGVLGMLNHNRRPPSDIEEQENEVKDCFIILDERNTNRKEKREEKKKHNIVFHNPNKRVRYIIGNVQQQQQQNEQNERMKANNDYETWYIIATIFAHILFAENTNKRPTTTTLSILETFFESSISQQQQGLELKVFSFFQSLQKLMDLLSLNDDDEDDVEGNMEIRNESKIEELIKNEILDVSISTTNTNEDSDLKNVFEMIYFHISLFLLVDRKIMTFTNFWKHRISTNLCQMFYGSGDDLRRRRRGRNNDDLDIIINLLHQINVEVCRIMNIENSADFFLRFEREFIRDFVFGFLWKNPLLQESTTTTTTTKKRKKMIDEDDEEEEEEEVEARKNKKIGEEQEEGMEYLDLLSHIFLDIMKEYMERRRRMEEEQEQDDEEEDEGSLDNGGGTVAQFVKRMMNELQRRGERCGNIHCKRVFDELCRHEVKPKEYFDQDNF